ncbi:hyphal wall protein 1-like [Mizuhopecten yessoensis]|uniref:Disintegrin and metalloproteinase domain-containing protein 29 n=1 Tax=Mizuhopecten yessoensis TaxID=6573 RepID=A0A210R4M9_MIZYE|nr:hyphal wall protein 1-like [Mizuhopecten yessoensis]OWF55962.1 Disintegrin and metalloproteinase domain-containing protein 29 [Mizuhopecten yessoensis]
MARHISVYMYILIVFIASLGALAASSTSPLTAKPSTAPSTSPSTAKPSTAPSTSPSTAKPSTTPTTTPSTAKPSTAPSTSPSTAKPSAAPSTSPSTARPSTAPSTAKPSTAPSTAKPSTAPTTTPTTPNPPSKTSTKSQSVAAASTLIPDTFYYNCTEDGGIEIINNGSSLSNVIIDYLNQSSGHCADPQTLGDGSVMLANCTKNTTIDIVLEATNETEILGGLHSKTFQIKCEDVNIKPYFLNVTANENVGGHEMPNVITMATKSTPSPISSLNMTVKDNNTGGNVVTEAYIGQELTIAITTPGKASIKPTECKATGNGKDVLLWQETGCKHDKELFGEKWTNGSDVIMNTLYGFRFVGSSTSITITCTVRVCPEGYKGHACDLTCKGMTKRKRVNRLSDDVTMEMATTSLAIKDPLLTSGVGQLGFELNYIIGLAVAVLVFMNTKCMRG